MLCTAGPHFIEMLLHHKLLENTFVRQFLAFFLKESVVKSVYSRCAVRALEVHNFTELKSILDVFLRIFETLAISYSS